MKYRNLGNSGMQVSVVGLGANNFGGRLDYQQTEKVIRQAIDIGINFIDTANIYGEGLSEEYIGKVLKDVSEPVLVATKVGMSRGELPNETGTSRKHIIDQVEISLRKLKRDYIDLYQIHQSDPYTKIEETLRALDDLIHQGKVLYIGCSNFSTWQICEAVWMSKALNLNCFVSTQPEYSMLERDVEKEMIPFCDKYGLGVLPYYPLARGFLTGKYALNQPIPKGTRLANDAANQKRLFSEKNFKILEALEHFATENGRTIVQLAIAWLLYNPAVSSVIAGATKAEQIIANAKASDWELSEEYVSIVNNILYKNS
jgi:aryl-alcohol dehydrogenase-like predicted oxidoreductase